MKHNYLGKKNMRTRALFVLVSILTVLPSAYSQDEEDMPEELVHFLEQVGILEKSFEMPFGEPDIVGTLLNGLYRNLAYWGAAMDTVETKAAVNAYLSIRWPQQEQNVLLDYLKASVHDKGKQYRAKQVLAAVCILGHKVDSRNFGPFVVTTIPILAEHERDTNPEGKKYSRIRRTPACCWAVQSLGLCDDPKYAALLRTAFFDSSDLLGLPKPLSSTEPLYGIKKHILAAHLYMSYAEAMSFYKDALTHLCRCFSHDDDTLEIVKQLIGTLVDSGAGTAHSTLADEWKNVDKSTLIELLRFCLYCVDEVQRREMNMPSKFPGVLRFQFLSKPFNFFEFAEKYSSNEDRFYDLPKHPWSLYGVDGELIHFPFGETEITEEQQMEKIRNEYKPDPTITLPL